jgi:phosphatidylserine synthase
LKLQTETPQQSFLYRNLANATSILGVLPLVLLFLEDGFRYLIPLIIFNNIMDDLDGVLAAKLNIRSRFGADLDNVCDAVAHVALTLAVGAHFGGLVLMMSMIATASIILRVTIRVNPEGQTGNGSPTNELMRHMLFVLLLTQMFDVDSGLNLVLMFLLHSVTMIVPFKLTALIRGLAKTATAVTTHRSGLYQYLFVFFYRWWGAMVKAMGKQNALIESVKEHSAIGDQRSPRPVIALGQ